MRVSDDHMIDGNSLLENVDVQTLEAQISQQMLENGFAQDAARQAALTAMESAELQQLAGENGIDLNDYYLVDENGAPVEGITPEPGQKPARLGSSPFTVVPRISSSTQHIGSGVRAEISVTARLL